MLRWMGFQASLFMDLLSAFIFVSRVHLSFLSLSSGVGETADQLHTLAPSALPLLILLTATAKKIKIKKNKRVPETFLGLTSYLLCFSPGAIALRKMEMIYKLVAWEEIKICDTAAGDLFCKQVWRVAQGSVLCVTVCVLSGTDCSSRSETIRAVTEEGREAHPEGLLVYMDTAQKSIYYFCCYFITAILLLLWIIACLCFLTVLVWKCPLTPQRDHDLQVDKFRVRKGGMRLRIYSYLLIY